MAIRKISKCWCIYTLYKTSLMLLSLCWTLFFLLLFNKDVANHHWLFGSYIMLFFKCVTNSLGINSNMRSWDYVRLALRLICLQQGINWRYMYRIYFSIRCTIKLLHTKWSVVVYRLGVVFPGKENQRKYLYTT